MSSRNRLSKKTLHSKRKAAFLFMLPAFLVLICFMAVPLIYGFKISFQNYNIAMPADMRTFNGLENYKFVLTDSGFRGAIFWTLIFVAIAVPGTVILAMLIALALNSKKIHGLCGRFIKTIFILPMMLCPVIAANVWYIIFAPDYGLINSTLKRLGFSTISFFGTTGNARLAILITEFWLATPYVMIILLAALTTVPDDLLEAARLDGANKLQAFFHVTLPCIRQIFILVISIRLMDAFKMFDIAFALTEGGPTSSTKTIAYYIYETGFQHMQLGKASAAAFLLFLIIAVITIIFQGITRRITEENT